MSRRLALGVLAPLLLVAAASTLSTQGQGATRPPEVWAWGNDSHGQLGNGSTSAPGPLQADQAQGITNVIALATGLHHTLALTADRRLYAWGANDHGQLGLGTVSTNPLATPTEVTGLSNVVSVGAGPDHSLAVTQSGQVYAWGSNNHGQLGLGTTAEQASPIAVPGLTGIAKVVGGGTAVNEGTQFSLALTTAGGVVAFGADLGGMLGAPCASFFTPANGNACESRTPVIVKDVAGVAITGATQIAAGDEHGLALLGSGEVIGWGENSETQLGGRTGCYDPDDPAGSVCSPAPLGLSGTSIAAGRAHSLVVSSGKVTHLGDAPYAGSGTVAGLRAITSVAASPSATGSLALATDGTVFAFACCSGSGYPTTPKQIGGPTSGQPLDGMTLIAAGGEGPYGVAVGDPSLPVAPTPTPDPPASTVIIVVPAAQAPTQQQPVPEPLGPEHVAQAGVPPTTTSAPPPPVSPPGAGGAATAPAPVTSHVPTVVPVVQINPAVGVTKEEAPEVAREYAMVRSSFRDAQSPPLLPAAIGMAVAFSCFAGWSMRNRRPAVSLPRLR